MENDLKNILSRIVDTAKLDCSAASLAYNPMERFAEYVSTKEIIHSKIIADLLKPDGEHQLGNGFLFKFLQKLGVEINTQSSPNAENPIRECKIDIEHYAPTALNGVETKGRIDIFGLVELADKKKYAIIIENKLNDACDQPWQLERYTKYINDNYEGYEVKTVYLPRIKREVEGATVIDATELANIIDETISPNNPPKAAIQAYTNYLKNISKKNIIMDNAIKLASMSAEVIRNAKAIKEAYEFLPQAFAVLLKERLEKSNDGKVGFKTKIAEKYSHYCYIWNKHAYNATGLWLAVGFYDECYRIYIVSDDEDKLKKNNYEAKLQLSEPEHFSEDLWLKPQKKDDFEVKFEGAPDFTELQETVDKWLKELDGLTN